MTHPHLTTGNVHRVWPLATENIRRDVPEHPVAVVRAPIGNVWAGAMRTSKASSHGGGQSRVHPSLVSVSKNAKLERGSGRQRIGTVSSH